MIDGLAKKIVDWQVSKKHLSEQDGELYVYAYGLLIGQMINILIACLLAAVFDAYMVVAVYLISYIPLRSYAGGHHADSYSMCTVISTVILCVICGIVRILDTEWILPASIIGSLFCGIFILAFAPVQDHNKILESEEHKRYKKFSIAIWIIEVLIWTAFYCLGYRQTSLVIALSHLTVGVLLGMGILKNRCYAK